MTEQILRQAKNKVRVAGIAQEITLEKKSYNDEHGKPFNVISGDVIVKVGEDETHVIQYYAKEFTAKGEANKNYKALQTIKNEVITLADLAQGLVEGEPTKIICNGELTLNEYKGNDGEVKAFPRIKGAYSPNRHKDGEFKEEATFDIEGIVKATRKEMVGFGEDKEESGRLLLDLYVPLYKGVVVPLTFVTDESVGADGLDYLEENFTPRSSVNIYGSIVNKSKKIERVVESTFGKNKTEVTYERTREFAFDGGCLYEEGIHDNDMFNVSLLKEALANRARHLSALKEKEVTSKPKDAEKSKGFGQNSAPKNTAPKTEESVGDIDDLFGED